MCFLFTGSYLILIGILIFTVFPQNSRIFKHFSSIDPHLYFNFIYKVYIHNLFSILLTFYSFLILHFLSKNIFLLFVELPLVFSLVLVTKSLTLSINIFILPSFSKSTFIVHKILDWQGFIFYIRNIISLFFWLALLVLRSLLGDSFYTKYGPG